MTGVPESASERGSPERGLIVPDVETFHDIEPPTLKQAVFEAGLQEALRRPTHEGQLVTLGQLHEQVRRRRVA